MPDATIPPTLESERRRWMQILARAPRPMLDAAWAAFAPSLGYDIMRPPETGLVLVRGRIGGSGASFNFGEMTMTRCAVRLVAAPRTIGFGFVAGREPRRAELAAVFDALMLDPQRRARLEASLIAPAESALAAHRQAAAAEIAPTRVDFFTLVREQT